MYQGGPSSGNQGIHGKIHGKKGRRKNSDENIREKLNYFANVEIACCISIFCQRITVINVAF